METKQRNETRGTAQQAAPLVPPVDIIETPEGITLRADLPGVSKETLSIDVDGDTMTVEGTVSLGEPANVKPLYAEIRVAQFRRSFVLGADLDSEKVDANIRNGVLTIKLAKREQAKPRKIEVKAA